MKNRIQRYKFSADEISHYAESNNVSVSEVEQGVHLPDWFTYRGVVFEREKDFDIRSGRSFNTYKVIRYGELSDFVRKIRQRTGSNRFNVSSQYRNEFIYGIDKLFLRKENETA